MRRRRRLQWAIRRRTCDAEKIRTILASDPGAVFRADVWGFLPLHHACQNKAGRAARELLEIVRLLVDAHPGGLLISAAGSVPLHQAVRCGAHLEVIEYLIHRCMPVFGANNWENLPLRHLHHAGRSGGRRPAQEVLEIVRLLADAHPETLLGRLHSGTPLHDAIQYGSHLEVIEYLIHRCPKALEISTSGGLPLHLAAKLGRTDVIECMIRRFPQALERKDWRGQLPVHIAVQTFGKLEMKVAQWLPHRSSALLLTKDKDGRTPLHNAAQYGAVEVVTCLLDRCPEAARERNNKGQLPLHVAARHASSLVVTCLLDRCPKAAQERDNNGQTPLHLAAASKHSSVDTVALLLDRCPKAARERDKNGQTPLHISTSLRPVRGEIVTRLVDRCPEAARERDSEGQIPLHVAAFKYGSVEVVTCLVDRYPGAAREKDNKGQLPLHVAARQAYSKLVTCLLDRCPEAARERDNDGQTPLHGAAARYGSDEVVMCLVDRCPDAAWEKDNSGRTPLHIAVGFRHRDRYTDMDMAREFEVVQCLANCGSPTLLLERDGDGRVPLDLAVQNNAPRDVVEALVVRCPQALQIKDSDGNLFLHRLVTRISWSPYLEVLVRGFPEALLCKNDAGWTPLHLALQGGSVNTYHVRFIVNKCPESLRVTASRNDRLALHIALAHCRASRELPRCLAEPYPEALTVKDRRGWLPLHVAAQYAKLDVVQFLARESPTSALETTTEDGWLAMHVAAKRGDLEVIQCLVEHGGHESLRQPTRKEGWLPFQVAAVHDAPLSVVYYLLRTLPPKLG